MKNKSLKFILFALLILNTILIIYPLMTNKKKEVVFTINQDIFTLKVGDSRKIDYYINNPNINIIWKSSNENVAIVNNGIIKGLKTGTTIISITINNQITESINIEVKNKLDSITFNYSPKEVLKVGDTITLYPSLFPTNAKDEKIVYESSNSNVLSVTENGTIRAKKTGIATITIKSEDESIKKTLSFTILNSIGLINSTQYIWDFSKSDDVIPKRADNSFFMELAKKGRGTLSNDIYTYQKYSYNISNSILTIDGKNKIQMRIYYPENKDLSSLNTFTFLGGLYEENFGSYFSTIDKNTYIIKSSGIIILIPSGNNSRYA